MPQDHTRNAMIHVPKRMNSLAQDLVEVDIPEGTERA